MKYFVLLLDDEPLPKQTKLRDLKQTSESHHITLRAGFLPATPLFVLIHFLNESDLITRINALPSASSSSSSSSTDPSSLDDLLSSSDPSSSLPLDDEGGNLLHTVCRTKNSGLSAKIIKCLLKKKFSPSLLDREGKTPAILALESNNLTFFYALMEYAGESLGVVDQMGRSCAHVLCESFIIPSADKMAALKRLEKVGFCIICCVRHNLFLD